MTGTGTLKVLLPNLAAKLDYVGDLGLLDSWYPGQVLQCAVKWPCLPVGSDK